MNGCCWLLSGVVPVVGAIVLNPFCWFPLALFLEGCLLVAEIFLLCCDICFWQTPASFSSSSLLFCLIAKALVWIAPSLPLLPPLRPPLFPSFSLSQCPSLITSRLPLLILLRVGSPMESPDLPMNLHICFIAVVIFWNVRGRPSIPASWRFLKPLILSVWSFPSSILGMNGCTRPPES